MFSHQRAFFRRISPVRLRSTELPSPFAWIRPQKLAIGGFPDDPAHWGALEVQGLRAVFSCCDPSEGHWSPPAHWVRRLCPLPDHRQPHSLSAAHLLAAIGEATALVKDGQPLYLHCRAGIERSPLLAIALQCTAWGMDLFEALSWVKRQHPEARPLTDQLLLLEALQADGFLWPQAA
ncbi:dual specificity protein phosphatase family protein [Synechococcus sp. CS-1325]|nr:dual specificity protein phosphatase family protein [Synechococcus sp. CS-1325]PZU99083.1 MAG: hypothetical protein DCF24_09825 [Cyanobium sp.]